MARTIVTIALDWPDDELVPGTPVTVTPIIEHDESSRHNIGEPVPGEIIKVDINP